MSEVRGELLHQKLIELLEIGYLQERAETESAHVLHAALIGADVITAPPTVIKKLADHPLTDAGLAQFMADWAKTGQNIL